MMLKYAMNKLIRHKLIPRMHDEGVVVNYKTLSDEEYIAKLFNKLEEETEEAKQETDKDKLAIELADVLEVVLAIASAHEIDISKIETERLKKREINGTFNPSTYVKYIEVAKDNHKVIKYLADQNKPYIFEEI